MERDESEERELMLFQDYMPHLAAPATDKEKRRIKFHLDLQDNIREGWMSKAIEDLQAKNVKRTGHAMGFNPFEDVPQWGLKTGRGMEKAPKFSDFPFGLCHAVSAISDVDGWLTVADSEGEFPQRALGGHRSPGQPHRP
jgi:hypothetical protein